MELTNYQKLLLYLMMKHGYGMEIKFPMMLLAIEDEDFMIQLIKELRVRKMSETELGNLMEKYLMEKYPEKYQS